MNPTKWITSFAVVVGTAGIVAGCGGSSPAKHASVTPGSSSKSVATAPAPTSVTMLIKSDSEKGKLGSDGKWHDAFLPGDLSVQAGQMVTVTVKNYDDSSHSFTAPGLGINETIPGGSASSPHIVTFTFKAPAKAGAYQWFCAMPCDPWAMAHDGFMRGYVNVTA